MAKRASKTDRKLTKPDTPTRPRSQALPGMEDRAIKPLEDIATAYADVRDRRMELTKEESDLKKRAQTLMHKHNKTIYRHDGIEIQLIEGEEKVKVRVKKPGAPDDRGGDDEDEEPIPSADEQLRVGRAK